jgi:hypothetical protein
MTSTELKKYKDKLVVIEYKNKYKIRNTGKISAIGKQHILFLVNGDKHEIPIKIIFLNDIKQINERHSYSEKELKSLGL